MTISKKSWHYRLLLACHLDHQELPAMSVCSYVWSLVLTLFVTIPFVTASFLFFVLVLITTSPIWGPIVWLEYRYEQKAKMRRQKEDDLPVLSKSESLLQAWLRAKKEKVYPLLKWED